MKTHSLEHPGPLAGTDWKAARIVDDKLNAHVRARKARRADGQPITTHRHMDDSDRERT